MRKRSSALLWFAAILCVLASSRIPEPLVESRCDVPVEVAGSAVWTTHVACAEFGAATESVRGPARLLFGQTLDLNRADVAALEVLPQIGPRRAAAIAQARGQRRFASMNDVARVPGIGPRTVEGLRGWASVEVAP